MGVSKLVLFLQIVYILHGMPVIGYNFPAMIYAGIVVFLFVYLCLQVGRRQLITLLSIFFIHVLHFFIELFSTSDIVTILQQLSTLFQAWIYPLMTINIIRTSDIKGAHIIFFVYLTWFI